MNVVHLGRPVAWGKRRRDWQIGSQRDRREVCQLERLAGAIQTEPIVIELDVSGLNFERLLRQVGA